MQYHFIIENLESYDFVKTKYTSKNICFWTTNEEIIQKLSSTEKISHLEKFAKQQDINNIGKACYLFQEKICNEINKKFKFDKNINYGEIFSNSIYRNFFILNYKCFLIKNLLKKFHNKNIKLFCVGNAEIKNNKILDINFDRFDNIFSILSNHINDLNIENLHYQIDKKKLDFIKHEAENRRLSIIEKYLSIMDNTFSSFCYKIYHKIYYFLKLEKINFFKKRIYIFGYNDTISHLFLKLLIRGNFINFLDKPKNIKFNEKNLDLSIYKFISENSESIILNHLKIFGIENDKFQIACVKIFSKRISSTITNLQNNLTIIDKYYNNLVSKVKENSIILSNGFFSSNDILLFYYLKKKNSKIISFDHGISMGMSKYRDFFDRFYGTKHGDVGIYSNNFALNTSNKYAPKQKSIVAGPAPQIGVKVNLNKLILKSYFKIEKNKKVIIIVAKLARNNLFISPYQANDYKFYKITKKICEIVCKEKKNHVVILKLYPGSRYVDEYEFEDLKKYKNLKIIKNFDFRWLRLIGDIIITTSTESTLGQILENKSNNYFRKLNTNPNYFDKHLKKGSIFTNMKNLYILDKEMLLGKRDYNQILKEIN